MIQTASQKLEEKIIINRPYQEVYGYLKNMRDWPDYLPHVKKIDVLYDDGEFQEFYMDVLSENNILLNVRSVRKCVDAESIQFFQPKPPAFLKHHAGGWRFKAIDLKKCEVLTYHQWDLAEASVVANKAAEISHILSEHARLALSTWKKVIEQS